MFSWTFRPKVARSGPCLKKAWKIIDFAQTSNFSSKLVFSSSFRPNVGKNCSFREKARKIIHLAETRNFSSKLACFGVFVKFSGQSSEKSLISWKSVKNHRFGENYQLFEQTSMFRRFHQLFGQKLEKVAHFVKKHEKWSISLKVGPLEANYHVLAFLSTFGPQVIKSRSFREKAWKIIYLAKTSSFWSKLACFRVFINFSAKTCKKWLISWKSMTNRRFGQNY